MVCVVRQQGWRSEVERNNRFEWRHESTATRSECTASLDNMCNRYMPARLPFDRCHSVIEVRPFSRSCLLPSGLWAKSSRQPLRTTSCLDTLFSKTRTRRLFSRGVPRKGRRGRASRDRQRCNEKGSFGKAIERRTRERNGNEICEKNARETGQAIEKGKGCKAKNKRRGKTSSRIQSRIQVHARSERRRETRLQNSAIVDVLVLV